MKIGISSRQYARIHASELGESIQIKDASRIRRQLENKVELSEGLFPRQFEDGEIINFHLEDVTMGDLITKDIFLE